MLGRSYIEVNEAFTLVNFV